MTDNDRKLILEASKVSRFDYAKIYGLIAQCETDAARERLEDIIWELRESLMETN